MSEHNENRAFAYVVGGAIGAALIATPGLLLPWALAVWVYVAALGAGAGWAVHTATKSEDVPALHFERRAPERTDQLH